MKRAILFTFTLALLLMTFASAQQTCNLDVQLINQDPFPAVPGDYVRLVFQVDGVDDPSCGTIIFALIEDFPIKFDPGVESVKQITSGTSTNSEFKSFLQVPYRVRVDESALDGDNRIEVRYTTRSYSSISGTTLLEDFNINVENALTDFEVSIKDYDAKTQTLTFEILNIGENDIEALTIEIPKQETIEVKGSTRNIVGSLDSSEDTTFDFEAIPKPGDIKLTILYTDQINVRRTMEKTVVFDPMYFENRARDQKQTPISLYITLVVIALIIFFWIRGRLRKKRKKHHTHHSGHHSE